MVVRRCPTLPQPPGCSTIGAVGLSFRVRNGTGRFPHAITTVTLAPLTPNTPIVLLARGKPQITPTPQQSGVWLVIQTHYSYFPPCSPLQTPSQHVLRGLLFGGGWLLL